MGKLNSMATVACFLLATLPALAGEKLPELKTVASVDLERYAGRWYEIASFPNRFQKGCSQSTAEYALKQNGRVSVRNSCVSDSNGKLRSVEGEARVVEPLTQAKLKVTFLPQWLRWLPVGYGDYWVIDLDPDYRWSVVSSPGRDYLWILSRTPTLSREDWEGILTRAREQGLAVERLRVTRPGGVSESL